MDDRKLYILGAILRSYIESAEPIGSRTLQREFDMGVSAATIRNEMSDLEHLGYLMKAHTSSGRIPSDRAYRWYVDRLLDGEIKLPDIPALYNTSLLHRSNALESVLDGALRMLSESTNYIAFAMVPGRGNDTLRKIELIALSPREVVVVFVYKTKLVHTELVHLHEACDPKRIQRAGEIFQRVFGDKPLREAAELLRSGLISADSAQGSLFSEVIASVRREIAEGVHPTLRFAGLNLAFRIPEYGTREEAQEFVRRLAEGSEWLPLLQKDMGSMEVFIGDESGIGLLESSAVVAAPYHVRGNLIGKIGVVGPKRMEYGKVIADVAMMSRYIDSIATRG